VAYSPSLSFFVQVTGCGRAEARPSDSMCRPPEQAADAQKRVPPIPCAGHPIRLRTRRSASLRFPVPATRAGCGRAEARPSDSMCWPPEQAADAQKRVPPIPCAGHPSRLRTRRSASLRFPVPATRAGCGRAEARPYRNSGPAPGGVVHRLSRRTRRSASLRFPVPATRAGCGRAEARPYRNSPIRPIGRRWLCVAGYDQDSPAE
jgi:hypothetical protein